MYSLKMLMRMTEFLNEKKQYKSPGFSRIDNQRGVNETLVCIISHPDLLKDHKEDLIISL